MQIGSGPIGQYALGEGPSGLAAAVFADALGCRFSEPVRLKIAPALAIALIASGTFVTLLPEQGSLTGSYSYPWSEPVRQKPGTHASRQQTLAYVAAGTQNAPFNRGEVNFAEETAESKHHHPWSEPKRFPKGLPTYLQQTFTADTIEVPTGRGMGWYAPLSEPKRFPKGLAAEQQRAFTIDVDPVPLSKGIGWYANFSEPVRIKRGLYAHLQDPDPLEVPILPSFTVGFFNPYSEPVRFKQGLAYYLQQSLAYHPRLLPTPDVTVTWNSTETGVDVALIAVNVYTSGTTATSGEGAKVSITEITPSGLPVASGNDPVSVRES